MCQISKSDTNKMHMAYIVNKHINATCNLLAQLKWLISPYTFNPFHSLSCQTLVHIVEARVNAQMEG